MQYGPAARKGSGETDEREPRKTDQSTVENRPYGAFFFFYAARCYFLFFFGFAPFGFGGKA